VSEEVAGNSGISRQDLLDTADATKKHAEINQIRNQEFLICSFALVFYGASFSAIATEPVLVIPLLLAFAALYYWYFTLGAVRTRMSVYLDVKRLSQWEGDYRKFADTTMRHPSQRTAAAVLFVILGVIGTAWGSWKLHSATVPAELHQVYPPASAQQVRTEPMTQDASADEAAASLRREVALLTAEREREVLLSWMIGSLVAYVLIISYFGFKKYHMQRGDYEEKLRQALGLTGPPLDKKPA
jgi:hypothetical protein